VAVGDADRDGRLDLVAGGVGEDSFLNRTEHGGNDPRAAGCPQLAAQRTGVPLADGTTAT
jgi:hypothetical protein